MDNFKRALKTGKFKEALDVFQELSKEDLEGHSDILYVTVNCLGRINNQRSKEWDEIFRAMMSMGIKSRGALSRALQCHFLSIATELWDAGYRMQEGETVLFSLDAMQWAKERSLPSFPGAMFDIEHVWNGDAVIDRIVMLFRDFDYLRHVEANPEEEIGRISNRGILSAILPYLMEASAQQSVLDWIVKKAAKLCEIPVILTLVSYFDSASLTKALKYARSYEDVAILASLLEKTTHDLVHVVFQSKHIDDSNLVEIIEAYFNVCYNSDVLQDSVEKHDLWRQMIRNHKMKAAKCLGHKLAHDSYGKRRAIQVDWGCYMNNKLWTMYEGGRRDADTMANNYQDWWNKFVKLDPAMGKRVAEFDRKLKLFRETDGQEFEPIQDFCAGICSSL